MKMQKLSLIAALALGSLLACTTITSAQDAKDGKKGGRMTIEQRMERLTTALTLTDEQKPKIKAVFEETAKKMQAIPQDERREKSRTLREEETKQIKAILTAEQGEKYDKLMADMRRGGKKKAE
jgi:Spy/CpxP family protein refolding chaperone